MPLTIDRKQARQPAPGELTTKQMLESVQAAKRALESIEAAKPPTKADGYLGHIVV